MKSEKVIDIDKELDEIIFKYDIDRFYPRYRQMRQAEELIRQFVAEWKPEERVACIYTVRPNGEGKEARERFECFLSDVDNIEIDFFECCKSSLGKGYDDVYECDVLPRVYEDYDKIVLLSYRGEEFVVDWLHQHLPLMKYVSLYDYFAVHGLYMDHEYYQYISEDVDRPRIFAVESLEDVDNIIFEIVKQRNKLRNEDDVDTKKLLYQKIFCLALILRDFLLAEQYVTELLKMDSIENIFETVWEEIQRLLKKVKCLLAQREKRDILLFWIDNTSYELVQNDMPFLVEMSKQATCFHNMVTSIPYTSPTICEMFCKQEAVHKSLRPSRISVENSIVCRTLNKYGYNFFTTRSHGWDALKDYNGSKYFRKFSPMTNRIWTALAKVIASSEQMFSMVHIVMEPHGPFMSIDMERNDLQGYKCFGDYYEKNAIIGRYYVDKQLKYYDQFVSGSMSVMYMTDHGNVSVEIGWPKEHTFFAISNNKASNQIHSLTSLLDFSNILENVILKKPIMDSLPIRDYVHIQNLMYYSKERISPLFQARDTYLPWSIVYAYGYQGIVTKEYVYRHYDTGHEVVIPRDMPYYSFPPYIVDMSQIDSKTLEQFREWAHIDESPKIDKSLLKHAYFFRDVVKNAMPRNIQKVQCLNDILAPYEKGSVAIRTGGGDACDIYLGLRQENKEKVACVIDPNPGAPLHAKLGLPVVSPDKADMSQFSAVILGTRRLRPQLLEEAKGYPEGVDVLDIEALLAEKGYHCGPSFWDIETVPEDWDVGFPYSEIEG